MQTIETVVRFVKLAVWVIKCTSVICFSLSEISNSMVEPKLMNEMGKALQYVSVAI